MGCWRVHGCTSIFVHGLGAFGYSVILVRSPPTRPHSRHSLMHCTAVRALCGLPSASMLPRRTRHPQAAGACHTESLLQRPRREHLHTSGWWILRSNGVMCHCLGGTGGEQQAFHHASVLAFSSLHAHLGQAAGTRNLRHLFPSIAIDRLSFCDNFPHVTHKFKLIQ